MKKGKRKIVDALVNAINGLSFTELKKETGLSNTALANYLIEMQETHLVRKVHDGRKYRLPEIYYPMDYFSNDGQKMMKVSAENFSRMGIAISRHNDRQERIVIMKKFLKGSFYWLTVFMWKIIGEAILEYGNDFKNLENEEIILKKSKIIAEAMKDWVIPITDYLASAMVLNIDIIDEAGDPVFNEVAWQAQENYEELIKFIDGSKIEKDIENGYLSIQY